MLGQQSKAAVPLRLVAPAYLSMWAPCVCACLSDTFTENTGVVDEMGSYLLSVCRTVVCVSALESTRASVSYKRRESTS